MSKLLLMKIQESIQSLAEVQFNQLRKQEGCGKLQFTSYSKRCMSCKSSEDCQKLYWILTASVERS